MRTHYKIPNIGIGIDHDACNTAYSKLSEKIQELGMSYSEIMGFLKDHGLLDISIDRVVYKLSGDAIITDVELIMWAKLLRCTVEELVSQFRVNPKLDDISDELFNLSRIKKEINSLYPAAKWHPRKPYLHPRKNTVKWDDESNDQLWAFYMEYGNHVTTLEYSEISPEKIHNKISQLRKRHHDQLSQLIYDNTVSPFFNFAKFYDSFGTNATAERYGISIEKVEEYAQVVHYLNSIKID